MDDIDEAMESVRKDRLGRMDWVLAILAGILVSFAYFLFPYATLTPELWADAAAIAGVRPPSSVFPGGLWRIVAEGLYSEDGATLLLTGRILAGVFAFLVYFALRNLFAILVRPTNPSRLWSRVLAPAVALYTALSIGVAEPVWRVFAVFSPAAVFLFLSLLTVVLFELFVLRGWLWLAALHALVLGLLAAETPLAWLLVVGYVVAFHLVWRAIRDATFRPDCYLRTPSEMPKWLLFFAFVGGFALGVWANVDFLLRHGALEAWGWEAGDMFFRCALAYLRLTWTSGTWAGWILGLGFGILPFVVVARLFPMATDDFHPVPFAAGVVLLFAMLAAYGQSGPFRWGWFWTWVGESESIRSASLLAFFSVLSGFAFTLAAGAFGFDAFCRLDDRDPRIEKLYRGAWAVLAVAAFGVLLPRLPHANTRDLLAFAQDAVRETVRETGDAERIFTDGSLDPALELEAHRVGRKLYAINMMGTSSDFHRFLRYRGLTDEADLKAAETGAPVLFRVWAGEKTNGLDSAALQLGFEYWKRERLPLPPVSSFVGRTKGLDTADVTNAPAITKTFSRRAIALSKAADSAEVSPALKDAYAAIAWRLSRMARLRDDDQTADELDEANSTLKRMLDRLEYERQRAFLQMTPHEGLQIALKRADFTEAKRFASSVLKVDDEDPEANFGMGMSYLIGGDLKNAELYLRKCLVRRPNEPATINNLSIICRKTGRYQEAVDLAKKAYDLLPNYSEVKKTLADAEKALKEGHDVSSTNAATKAAEKAVAQPKAEAAK